MKTVFTTGEAGRICKVSQQTIIRCFDNGQLKGFRVPGSRFRRIPREALYKFMKANGIPTDALENTHLYEILVIGAGPPLLARLEELLPKHEAYTWEAASSGFDAGMRIKSLKPDMLIIDLEPNLEEGLYVAHKLGRDAEFESMQIVALAPDTVPNPVVETWERAFHAVFKRPFDPALLAEWIRACAQEKRGEV